MTGHESDGDEVRVVSAADYQQPKEVRHDGALLCARCLGGWRGGSGRVGGVVAHSSQIFNSLESPNFTQNSLSM